MSQVLTNLSNVYRFWRITHLKISIYPNGQTTPLLVQYVPGGGSTGSGAADNTMESRFVACVSGSTAVPQHIVVSKDMLCDNLTPWFATQVDATDAYLDILGYVNVEGGTADNFLIRYEIDYEFKIPQHTDISFAVKQRPQEQRVAQPPLSRARVIWN